MNKQLVVIIAGLITAHGLSAMDDPPQRRLVIRTFGASAADVAGIIKKLEAYERTVQTLKKRESYSYRNTVMKRNGHRYKLSPRVRLTVSDLPKHALVDVHARWHCDGDNVDNVHIEYLFMSQEARAAIADAAAQESE